MLATRAKINHSLFSFWVLSPIQKKTKENKKERGKDLCQTMVCGVAMPNEREKRGKNERTEQNRVVAGGVMEYAQTLLFLAQQLNLPFFFISSYPFISNLNAQFN